MNFSDQLPVEVKNEIISEIQRVLWLQMNTDGDSLNPDKEWDSETVECIAALLDHHGLRPDDQMEPVPVIVR